MRLRLVLLVLLLGVPTRAVAQQGVPADSLPPIALLLDTEGFRLDVLLDGQVVREFPVAVGAAAFPTPDGAFLIRHIEFNPSWTPPDSPWADGQVRMPPGPRNPMGRAKIQFAPLYFLHGTPDTASIGKAASHGCVRLHNRDILALADLLLTHAAGSVHDSTRQALLSDAHGTRRVPLDLPVPLTILPRRPAP